MFTDPLFTLVITEAHSLPNLLRKMLDDLRDPACFYWLYANYVDIQPSTNRSNTRRWQAPLFLNYDAIWNAAFIEDGMLCEVILKNQLPAQCERIKIDYDRPGAPAGVPNHPLY